MDDRDIIGLYNRRDEAALVETQEKYGRYLHHIAYNILGSDEDAEEVVQDAMLAAWNSIPPNEPVSLPSYLGRLARNCALDAYDKRTAEKRGGGAVPAVLDELYECVPSGDSDTADELALRDIISRFLRGLSSSDRRVFVLRYFYMYSVSEVADECGCGQSKIKMTLSRTRLRLRKYLEREGISI